MVGTVLGLFAIGGIVFAHAHALRKKKPDLLALTVCFDVIAGGLALVALASERTFSSWMQEDAWVEWASFVAFAAAGLVTLLRLRRRLKEPVRTETPTNWLGAVGLVGLALFCVFVAGEELSWGQRLFGFLPPEVFLEKNFQQELNVHNFLKGKELLHFKLDSRFLVALVAILYGLVLPGLALELRSATRRTFADAVQTVAPRIAFSPWFAAVAAAELVYPVSLTGEACELVLGLLFLANGVLQYTTDAHHPASLRTIGRVAASLAGACLLGALTPLLLQSGLYGSDATRERQALEELQSLRDDLLGDGHTKIRLRRKSLVHKRLYTAVRRGYLKFGTRSGFLEGRGTPAERKLPDPRRDRRGYFLDPWNNPYWIHFRKKDGRVVLYSFGADRHRDTRLRGGKGGEPAPIDDRDIGVSFMLPEVGPKGVNDGRDGR